jgi:O-methyltransferase domain/Dimerisation domain
MSASSPELEKQTIPPQAVLMQMGMGFIVSQAISVAAKLRIADFLSDGAKNIEELARATESHEPSLYRLMRALVAAGVFAQMSDSRFSNTPLSEFMRSDNPESLRGILHMMGDREHWMPHGNLTQSVKTGETAFEFTFGMPVFPYYSQNPEAAAVFDGAMTSFSANIARAVVAAYDFSHAKTIADIGGGHGLLLSSVLKNNPQAKGILFDQPQVVAGASDILEKAGVGDRTEVLSGDFFREVTVHADVYLMKHIIHDWNDKQSESILKNLAESAPAGAKLLLVESVVEEDNSPSMSKVMDLNMLVMTGGKERTAAEYAALFERCGFKLVNILPTQSPVQIVEAVRI